MKKIRHIIFQISFILMLFAVPAADLSALPVHAEVTVYVTQTGAKYHTHKCGNGNYYPAGLSTALARGLTPCQKCYGSSGGYGDPGANTYTPSVPEPYIPEPSAPEPVKVSLNSTNLTLIKGQSKKLRLKGATETVKWSTSKSKVASVKRGKVKAKSKGKAVIFASANGQTKKCTVKVETPKLSGTTLKLSVNQKASLKLKGCSHKIKWSSSDSWTVSVSKGKVTAREPGTATISAKVHGKTYRCKVTVEKPSVENVTLSQTALSMEVNEEKTLRLNVPSNDIFLYHKYTVSSSNTQVLLVSDSGDGEISLWAGRTPGTAVVAVQIGTKTLACTVTVVPPQVTELTFDSEEIEMDTNDSLYLSFQYAPWNALNYYKAEWFSSDESIVKVNDTNGSRMAELVTFGEEGEAVITLRLGQKEISCKVLVRSGADM